MASNPENKLKVQEKNHLYLQGFFYRIISWEKDKFLPNRKNMHGIVSRTRVCLWEVPQEKKFAFYNSWED